MKTKLIEELIAEPVEQMRERVYTPNRMVQVAEESEVIEDMAEQQERYRFELKLGARFVLFPGPEYRRERELRHELLIRTITEHIYGDVRLALRELYPIVADCADYETREEMLRKIEDLLDMTVPR